MNKYKFLLILLIMMVFVTGCVKNEKCVKSHKEKRTCISYRYIPKTNGGYTMIPIYYICEKEVCDLYERKDKWKNG